MTLSLKVARLVAKEYYTTKNVKFGILVTMLTSPNPVTVRFLNRKFNITSAAARIAEIKNETGMTFDKISFQDGSKGVSVAYAV